MHHDFAHAVVRGAGYAVGRDATRAAEHAIGLWGVILLALVVVLISAMTGRRR